MPPLPEPRIDDNSTADLTEVIRDRRRQVWRQRLLLIGAAAAILAIAAVLWFSPLLALEKVGVKGSELLDHEQVSEFVLDANGGTPLPRVRTGTVEKTVLKEFPRAKEAAVHYSGPRSLSIEITDRVPVLAITTTAGFELFDDEAVNLGTVKSPPGDVTVLEESGGPPDQETVAAVIRFMAELRPELRADLTSIHAKDDKNLAGVIDTGKTKAKVVFGDSTSASLKMRTALQLAADGRTDIDVSVPSVPVTN